MPYDALFCKRSSGNFTPLINPVHLLFLTEIFFLTMLKKYFWLKTFIAMNEI